MSEPVDGDSLPTYEYLEATEKDPNSRFGRWQGWIEKRAAERYLDQQNEEQQPRQATGWGERIITNMESPAQSPISPAPRTPRREVTSLSVAPRHTSVESLPTTEGDLLHPCHLTRHVFGSRFLPHSKTPINTLLPILSDKFLLMGTADGLSFLDILPGLHGGLTDGNAILRPSQDLSDARRCEIWQGSAVWQLTLLEEGEDEDKNPQGVALALVDSEGENGETIRVIRMYKLDNFARLVQWYATHKEAVPLSLPSQNNSSPHSTPVKKRRPRSGLFAGGLKSWLTDGPAPPPAPDPYLAPPAASGSSESPSSRSSRRPSNASERQTREHKDSMDSSWDLIEDLPLRWATDFIPLAGPKTRLWNTSVLFFELWLNDNDNSRGNAMLAIATKQNIFLYETPRGERAFRYVKEFYTPMPPRSISFIRLRHSESLVARSVSNPSQHHSRHEPHQPHQPHHHHHHSHNFHAHTKDQLSSPSTTQRSASIRSNVVHTSQLSLFVVFEKKAIVIRVADSAVNEIELWDDPTVRELNSPTSFRLSHAPMENCTRDMRNGWLPFSQIDILMSIPGTSGSPEPPPKPQTVGLLTRGKRTQIVPYPLRLPLAMPLRILSWEGQPSQIIPRILRSTDGEPSVLQVIAIGGDGIEVQELPLPFVTGGGKGKGRAIPQEIVRATMDIGSAGLLCRGGRWHEFGRPPAISRKDSMDSTDSELVQRYKASHGMYAWSQKGAEDWRVFWLGGSDEA